MLNRTAIQSRLREIVGKMPLSKFAKETGIPLSTLSRAYNGTEILNLDHMHKICDRFGVPLMTLLAQDDGVLSELPIRGFASCGVAQGWFVEEKHPKTVFVPSAFAMPSCFGILAKGDSMIPAGIESVICALSIRADLLNAANPLWCAPIGFTKAKIRRWRQSRFWNPKPNRRIF